MNDYFVSLAPINFTYFNKQITKSVIAPLFNYLLIQLTPARIKTHAFERFRHNRLTANYTPLLVKLFQSGTNNAPTPLQNKRSKQPAASPHDNQPADYRSLCC
ncbi:MAG: hypothetical protein ACE3JP_05760 [Ectobacillus sp.]